MLIASGSAQIAIHAFLPWFKSLRNAMVRHSGNGALVQSFDPNSPFSDGYFDKRQQDLLGLLHAGSLDVDFEGAEWPELSDRLITRARHDAAYLCPSMSELAGATTYREMMDRILRAVIESDATGMRRPGLIDTWIIDMLPALARAYPDALFLVVLRDPRAIIASTLRFLSVDPTQVGHILSIVRQWRKFVTLSCVFRKDPPLAQRVLVVRYEDQVAEIEQFARRVCDFLDLRFVPEMAAFSNYQNPSQPQPWHGNSAFEKKMDRIDAKPTLRWRNTLPTSVIKLIEFACGDDMMACGYEPLHAFEELSNDAELLTCLIQDCRRDCGWRTDSQDPQVDYGREAFRRMLPRLHIEAPDAGVVRHAYLDERYFSSLRAGERVF
jgi:hypothetical protein